MCYKALQKIVRGMRLAALISSGGSYPRPSFRCRGMGFFVCSLSQAPLGTLPNEKTLLTLSGGPRARDEILISLNYNYL